jgi:DNA repair protein RadC
MEFKVKYFYLKLSDNFNTVVTQPTHVVQFIKDDFEYSEKIIVLGMNVKNKILIKKDIAIGGYNSVICKPADIFIPLLKTNARSFIIAHNHISEDCTPSSEDIIFTKKLIKASEYVGLTFLDHMIVSTNDYYSFKQHELM